MEILNSVISDAIKSLRKLIILISIDNYRMHRKLVNGISSEELNSTEFLIIKCALVLEMIQITQERTYKWSDMFEELANNEIHWSSFINLIKHQISYLNILLAPLKANSNGPLDQLDNSPEEYIRFLKGVDSSHAFHAQWIATNPIFSNYYRLIDFGGGLGTFSYAWVTENIDRSSILIDFPKLKNLFSENNSKIKFIGADLEMGFDFKNIEGDLYLFSNVIHLLRNWNELLDDCFESMKPGNALVIFESNNEDEPGILFNYQVHMRSGFKSFLIPFNTINEKLLSLNCASIYEFTVLDSNDPYKRTYKLWICQK